jgi:hypothetical protein
MRQTGRICLADLLAKDEDLSCVMLAKSDKKHMSATVIREKNQLEQLTRLFDKTDELEFPICVEHRDRPDFALFNRTRSIGLEVGTFTDEEVHRGAALGDRRFPGAWLTLTGLHDRSPPRRSDEIVDTMLNVESPWPLSVDDAQHTVEKIFGSIRRKNFQLCSSGFKRFPENWLLLTDHLNFFRDPIGEPIIQEHLLTAVNDKAVIGTEFNRIYILYGLHCYRVERGKLAKKICSNVETRFGG